MQLFCAAGKMLETVILLTCVYLTSITIYLTVIVLQVLYLYWIASSFYSGNFVTATVAILLAATYFYCQIPLAATRNGHGRPFHWLRKSKLFKTAAKFGPTRLHKTVDLSPEKKYIFAAHPHSIIPMFLTYSIATEACGFNELFPGIERRGLVASATLLLPIWREFYSWLGYVDASYDSAIKVLDHSSLFLLPGGEQEMILAKPGQNKIILKNRTGFVRLALKSGALLVPVFAFNANDCETSVPGFVKMNQFLSKKIRAVFPVFYGSYGTPFPRKVPVDVVVGAPVPRPEFEGEVTNEIVEEYHARYMKALTELYESHKHKFGCSSIPLEILEAAH